MDRNQCFGPNVVTSVHAAAQYERPFRGLYETMERSQRLAIFKTLYTIFFADNDKDEDNMDSKYDQDMSNNERGKLRAVHQIMYFNLSHDVASGSEITPCIKFDMPLVVHRVFRNVMASKTMLRT